MAAFLTTESDQECSPSLDVHRRVLHPLHLDATVDLINPDFVGSYGPSKQPSQGALDAVLEAQFIVAWVGESGEGENRRLGWWKTQLGDEYAGIDLFRRLLPKTWRWAVLEAAREAARREDARRRETAHDADTVLSLFNLGFELDESIEQRLGDLRRATHDPLSVFSSLRGLWEEGYRQEALISWLEKRPPVEVVTTPTGRRIRGENPDRLEELLDGLLAGLLPLGNEYPVPHYRRPR